MAMRIKTGDVVRVRRAYATQSGTSNFDNRPYTVRRCIAGQGYFNSGIYMKFILIDCLTKEEVTPYFYLYEIEMDIFLTIAARKLASVRRKEERNGRATV